MGPFVAKQRSEACARDQEGWGAMSIALFSNITRTQDLCMMQVAPRVGPEHQVALPSGPESSPGLDALDDRFCGHLVNTLVERHMDKAQTPVALIIRDSDHATNL